jgi:hypothetical protein
MIRFVADPTGVIVPDLAAKLPGRGVWVTATKAAVAEAARRNVFAKSLKRAVKVEPDLADRVEALLKDRARQALAFANKAGLVVAGFAKVEAALGAGSAAVLIDAADAADDGVEKLSRTARRAGKLVATSRFLPSADLSLAIGRPNVVHACLKAGGQTRAFLGAALRCERYRQNDLGSTSGDAPAERCAPEASGSNEHVRSGGVSRPVAPERTRPDDA